MADDHKLIASHTIKTALLKDLFHALRAFCEYFIPKGMAVPVIDVLKSIDIQINDAHASLFAGHPLHVLNITVSVIKGGQLIDLAQLK